MYEKVFTWIDIGTHVYRYHIWAIERDIQYSWRLPNFGRCHHKPQHVSVLAEM